MAKAKKNNFAMSLGVLAVIIVVPTVFVIASIGTQWISSVAPYALLIVLALAIMLYTSMTTGLLYEFYEVDAPWFRWVPCVGELAMMDGKFLKFGLIGYAGAVLFLLLSFLPYSVVSFLGESIAVMFPFWMMVVAFVFLGAVQVVKGIGIMDCSHNIMLEFEERHHTNAGFIKRFSWIGFLPFIRVLAVFALNKPLATLVSFAHETISDNDDVVLEEEE